MSGTREESTDVDATARSASRFYWAWLVFATSVSVLGNIAHAVLVAADALWAAAAVLSVVPPAFVLGSTHSVALRLKMRRWGLAYALELLMTIGVTTCAFLLSFDALSGLAVMLGWAAGKAWLFPIAIDVSIAQATFGLLSLRPARAAPMPEQSTVPEPQPTQAVPTDPPAHVTPTPPHVRTAPRNGAHVEAVRATHPLNTHPAATTDAAGAPAGAKPMLTAVADSPAQLLERADIVRWKPTAHELVRNGTTSKDPETVAAILAEHAAGTPPTTISRRRRVHHSTVGRILAGAQDLTG